MATSTAAHPCGDHPQQHPQQPVQQHTQQHLQQQQHQQGSVNATAAPGLAVTEPWRPSEEEQGVIDAILAADPAQLQAQARRLRDEGKSVVTFSPKVRGEGWKGGGAAQEAEERGSLVCPQGKRRGMEGREVAEEEVVRCMPYPSPCIEGPRL